MKIYLTDEDKKELLNLGLNDINKYKDIIYNNKKYKTYKALCKELNISYSSFRRIKDRNKNWSLEEVVKRAIHNKNIKKADKHTIKKRKRNKTGKSIMVTYKDKTFINIIDALDYYGLDKQTYYYYKKKDSNKNKRPEEIIDIMMKKANDKTVVYKGKTYKTMAELCNEYKISVDALYFQRSRMNLSVEEAMDKILKKGFVKDQ